MNLYDTTIKLLSNYTVACSVLDHFKKLQKLSDFISKVTEINVVVYDSLGFIICSYLCVVNNIL